MRRKGAVPPIVTVLVTIASIVGASLVAWFLWSSTRTATTTPILEVTDAYFVAALGSSGSPPVINVTFTIRNVGQSTVSLGTLQVYCNVTGWSSPVTASCILTSISPGLSVSCKANSPSSISLSSIPDVLSCQVVIQGAGVVTAFRAYRP